MGQELRALALKVTPLVEPSPATLAEVIEIEKEAFGPGALDWWFMPVMIRYGRVFLLELDGQTIGLAHLLKEWSHSRTAFMTGLSVKSGFQGRGYGSYFLGGILEQLTEDGVSKVKLTVLKGNQHACRLYAGAGFKVIGVLDDEYGPGEDRVLMEKDLEPKLDKV